ncbi:uncharacterized protein PHALS_08501 [Plasmopara halstedii]|uniref:Uncharacterized protein n=1 Tax=Plasmopara halstedii TaxID=4781 RepID=A0A0P1ACL3_PLAHL|nr:uncharacterized protein PHALS_08501 [Plasmopara halstedii]CEG38423.1 hypothetical protein PHALS_08501 [Plasmopara halstedii]|eukprot:XP_024574792.1 hypothetical protein PHALS_08501 [Plasmopara halstedii]
MDRGCGETADPLAALEAEYAAVLEQDLHYGKDEESIGESYTLLPSSPCNSEDDVLDDDTYTEITSTSVPVITEVPVQQIASHIQEDKRAVIMQCMKQVKVRPPPWVEASKLTDDELINIVRKQLILKTSNAF